MIVRLIRFDGEWLKNQFTHCCYGDEIASAAALSNPIALNNSAQVVLPELVRRSSAAVANASNRNLLAA